VRNDIRGLLSDAPKNWPSNMVDDTQSGWSQYSTPLSYGMDVWKQKCGRLICIFVPGCRHRLENL
jgi:hypothetical protein